MFRESNYIYVLLTNTGTVLNSTIKQFTQAPYNHASISLDPFLEEMYSFGRKKATNPIWAGFVKEDITTGVYSYFPNTTCALYKLPVTITQREIINNKISEFSENEMIYSYNLIGLFGVLFNISYNRKNAYFCSEFVSEVLTDSKVINFNKATNLITPEDFRINFTDFLIYEGPLFEYPLLASSNIKLKDFQPR